MRENVGGADRALRAVAGPALLALGYSRWGGGSGKLAGLLAMLGGALITETAITRVCPLNEAMGVDTARRVRL
ncbi:YgaP family membrane protein [Longimicrobium sp.]|uniref:YgaP family membrane protein n=1 Tax=Longimicrobium sp. TaxID=2029185 RepID=UPI003B3AE30C